MGKWDVVVRQEGTLGWLDFSQNVTLQARETAFKAYNELARAKVRRLGLNFSAAEYINSSGIGLVISLVETAVQEGCKVYIYGLSRHYHRLFGIVGLLERAVQVTDMREVSQAEGY